MIKIIDEIMGLGKSEYMKEHIRRSAGQHPFIYVAQYIDETERFGEYAALEQPVDSGRHKTKGADMIELLSEGRSLAITHELFRRSMRGEALRYLKQYEYELIIDEEMAVISLKDYSARDIENSRDSIFTIEEEEHGGMVSQVIKWIPMDEVETHEYKRNGRFNDLREMAEGSLTYIYAEKKNSVFIASELIPHILTDEFFPNGITFMTYMFKYSTLWAYFERNGIQYELQPIVALDGSTTAAIKERAKTLITLCDSVATNTIPWNNKRDYWQLSMTDLLDERTSPKLREALVKKITTWLKNKAQVGKNKLLIGTFVAVARSLEFSPYQRQCEAFNLKATNKLRHRTAVAYIANVFAPEECTYYFPEECRDACVQQYALSTMVQFIWRSAIRNGEPIHLYIPSKRMRELFENWMEGRLKGF